MNKLPLGVVARSANPISTSQDKMKRNSAEFCRPLDGPTPRFAVFAGVAGRQNNWVLSIKSGTPVAMTKRKGWSGNELSTAPSGTAWTKLRKPRALERFVGNGGQSNGRNVVTQPAFGNCPRSRAGRPNSRQPLHFRRSTPLADDAQSMLQIVVYRRRQRSFNRQSTAFVMRGLSVRLRPLALEKLLAVSC